MKPKAFDYLRPETSKEAVDALAANGDDARIIAGGMSLVPMLNFRLAEPQILVDISKMESLNFIRIQDGQVEIGAATRQAQLEHWDQLGGSLPLLEAAFPFIGHYQTRARGTVCGSLAHADPSSELPLCLATLGGEVVLRSSAGERVLSADQFQTGMLSVAKRSDEMIAAARYPPKSQAKAFSASSSASPSSMSQSRTVGRSATPPTPSRILSADATAATATIAKSPRRCAISVKA